MQGDRVLRPYADAVAIDLAATCVRFTARERSLRSSSSTEGDRPNRSTS